MLVKGLKIKLGNGKSLNVWTDKWIECMKMKAHLIKNYLIDISLRVGKLIDFRARDWHLSSLEELLYHAYISLIIAMKLISGF